MQRNLLIYRRPLQCSPSLVPPHTLWRGILSRNSRRIRTMSDGQPAKKMRLDAPKVCRLSHVSSNRLSESTSQMIGTHNGTFHCDEALAVFLLKHTTTYVDAGSRQSSLTAPVPTLISRVLNTHRPEAVQRSCCSRYVRHRRRRWRCVRREDPTI